MRTLLTVILLLLLSAAEANPVDELVKADYYSMDPFHESADDATIDYGKAGEAMMLAMKSVNPKAVWVIQGWTENPRPQMVDGMKAGDLLVLDLFSECRPMFGAPSIFCGRPSMNTFQASSWSKMKNYYDPADTRNAAQLMNSVAEKYRGNNNFEYDLVDITRQALADQARLQYQRTIADYKAFARSEFESDYRQFLLMLLAQDKLLGTRPEFRLGHWTQAAANCGSTDEEKHLYVWNARVQITTWGNRYCADTGGLRDYAHNNIIFTQPSPKAHQ